MEMLLFMWNSQLSISSLMNCYLFCVLASPFFFLIYQEHVKLATTPFMERNPTLFTIFLKNNLQKDTNFVSSNQHIVMQILFGYQMPTWYIYLCIWWRIHDLNFIGSEIYYMNIFDEFLNRYKRFGHKLLYSVESVYLC